MTGYEGRPADGPIVEAAAAAGLADRGQAALRRERASRRAADHGLAVARAELAVARAELRVARGELAVLRRRARQEVPGVGAKPAKQEEGAQRV